MSVCPLLTSATANIRISCWFLLVHLVKIFANIYSKKRECDGWVQYTWFNPPKPGLQSRALFNTVCTDSTLLILFYFILFGKVFCILIHDYNPWFTGSHCNNVGCYNYNSIWPYYIVIHVTYYTMEQWFTRYIVNRVKNQGHKIRAPMQLLKPWFCSHWMP